MEEIKILSRVAAMERARYWSSGDYSVTDLINPPRVVALKKRHKDVIQPLSSVISAMLGTAVHEYFEKYLRMWVKKYEYADYSFERQLSFDFDTEVGQRKVSGRYDILDGADLWDIKTAKVWKKIFDPGLDEWHEQQNLYAYLCHLNGIELDTINIMALYKDWQESNALRDPRNYPQDQVVHYQLDYWPMEKTEAFLTERLGMHVSVEELSDKDLPLCTRKERWERFNGGHEVEYAIMKTPRAKRAAKLVKTTLDDALSIANGMKGITNESFIEVRYAVRKRCEKFCSVNDKCNDYIAYAAAKKNKSLNDFIPLRP